MWNNLSKVLYKKQMDRHLCTTKPTNFRVAVIGGAGGIGQALTLLLKLNKLVKELHVCDLGDHTPGVVADCAHICTSSVLKAFVGEEQMAKCIEGADVVIVPAGMPRKPGMTRDQLFDSNATVVLNVACKLAAAAPCALLAIITNPVNSVVPIAAEALKANKVYDPKRLFGVTTLDVVRARRFIGEFQSEDPQNINIPVVGGHSGITILPLFSQCKPKFNGKDEDIKKLTERIQNAGTEIVKLKAGKGSATLSMGFAGAYFCNALLRGLKGDKNIIECAYVASDVTELPYFATPIELGPDGLKCNLGLPTLSASEQESVKKLMPELKQNIEKGINFANK